ncbi:hypothetical protein Tco_0467840 [Tanacetum coccineum]
MVENRPIGSRVECSQAHDWNNATTLLHIKDFNGGPVAYWGGRRVSKLQYFNLFLSVTDIVFNKTQSFIFTRSDRLGGLVECGMSLVRTILTGDHRQQLEVLLRDPPQDQALSNMRLLIRLTVLRSTEKDADETPNTHLDLKTDEKPVDKEDQVFLDELERLKRQEKDAIDAAEALKKEFAQEIEDLLLQQEAAKLAVLVLRVSSFDLEAYSDSDYAGANLTGSNPLTGVRQFLMQGVTYFLAMQKVTIVATFLYRGRISCCCQLLGKHFLGKVTPLFASMLVQLTEDEGTTLERPSEPQPIPYPPHPSEATVKPQSDPSFRPSPTPNIPDSIPESSSGNHGGQSSSDKSLLGNEGDMTLQSVYDLCISLCIQVTDQAKEITHLKAQIKKLKKQSKPVITHHRAWMKSVSLKQRLAGKKSLKKNWMQRESVSKQGRKSAKAEPSVHRNPLFDELDNDAIDNMDTKDAQDVGRTRNESNVSTDRSKVSIDRLKDSTDKEEEGTDKDKDSTVSQDEGTEGRSVTPITSTTTPTITPITTPTMFGDDETIAQVLLNMSQAKAVLRKNEKGVELKDVEEIERPRPASTRSLLTLKPLPKIDPKDKGKNKIKEEDESDTESEEEERKRLAEEEATKIALSDEYDFIQARIKADRLLALRLQDEERAVHYRRKSKVPS